MLLRSGMVLLLAGLPLAAMADADADMALCTQMAQKFSTDAHGMSLADLDALKTCISTQQTALRGTVEQGRFQVGMERTRLRASLRDDL